MSKARGSLSDDMFQFVGSVRHSTRIKLGHARENVVEDAIKPHVDRTEREYPIRLNRGSGQRQEHHVDLAVWRGKVLWLIALKPATTDNTDPYEDCVKHMAEARDVEAYANPHFEVQALVAKLRKETGNKREFEAYEALDIVVRDLNEVVSSFTKKSFDVEKETAAYEENLINESCKKLGKENKYPAFAIAEAKAMCHRLRRVDMRREA